MAIANKMPMANGQQPERVDQQPAGATNGGKQMLEFLWKFILKLILAFWSDHLHANIPEEEVLTLQKPH